MARYLLFAGSTYYPYGGWEDFIGVFESVEEAKSYFHTHKHDELWEWYHIVEIDSLKLVEKRYFGA